jgi:hypothetical protein
MIGRMRVGLVVLAAATLVSLGSELARAASADPRVGTWTKRISVHALVDPEPLVIITPQTNGIHLTRVNSLDQDKPGISEDWTAQFDGRDYPVSNYPNFDHVNVRRSDQNTIEVVGKRGVANITTYVLRGSMDGKEMIFTNTLVPGVINVYERPGGATDPTNPLAGIWTKNQEQTIVRSASAPLIFEWNESGEVRYSKGRNLVYSAKADGQEHVVSSGNGKVTITVVDNRTVQETYRESGKVINTIRYVLAADSLEMTVTEDGIRPNGARTHQVSVWRKE